jgi:hypothetical protein
MALRFGELGSKRLMSLRFWSPPSIAEICGYRDQFGIVVEGSWNVEIFGSPISNLDMYFFDGRMPCEDWN